jgi:hypothetical protein
MIERILPPPVAAADAFGDALPEEGVLFPEEQAVIARAAEGRRREFVTTRLCARMALASWASRPLQWCPDRAAHLGGRPGWSAASRTATDTARSRLPRADKWHRSV